MLQPDDDEETNEKKNGIQKKNKIKLVYHIRKCEEWKKNMPRTGFIINE